MRRHSDGRRHAAGRRSRGTPSHQEPGAAGAKDSRELAAHDDHCGRSGAVCEGAWVTPVQAGRAGERSGMGSVDEMQAGQARGFSPPGPRARHGRSGGARQRGPTVRRHSTGGTCGKLPGREGDSPLIGCGCYADSEVGGVSCTGYGEAIMKIVMAKTAADLLRRPGEGGAPENSAMRAAKESIELLSRRTQATGGLILLDRDGVPGFAHNTPRMAYGYVAEDGAFVVRA